MAVGDHAETEPSNSVTRGACPCRIYRVGLVVLVRHYSTSSLMMFLIYAGKFSLGAVHHFGGFNFIPPFQNEQCGSVDKSSERCGEFQSVGF